VTAAESVIIYDYESFTSTLDEIRSFIRELGDFFSGTTVWLVGSKHGPKEQDLGELLHAFNQDCNFDAEFDVSKVLPSDEHDPIRWHTCGMLGVPGDIASKTLLHGIHTLFICSSLDKSRCIGDDARISLLLQSLLCRVLLEDRLRNIGRISLEKTEEFEYDDTDDYELRAWHYAKRPILRTRNRVIQQHMDIFATLDCLLGLSDPMRTVPRFSTEITGRRIKFSNVWLRFVTRLHIEGTVREDEAEFLYHYQVLAFRELGITGLRAGRHRIGDSSFHVPPFLQPSEFGEKVEGIISAQYGFDEEIEVFRSMASVVRPFGYVSETFESRSCALYGFLEKMGILEKKNVYETVSRRMVGDDAFVDMLLGRFSASYEYTVLRPIPYWAFPLVPGIN
jgi:hypothetical protein